MIATPVSYDVVSVHEIGHMTGLSSHDDHPCTRDDEEHQIDLLGCYLAEIGRYPLLTNAQEQVLTARVAQGDTQARHQLIEANLRLVVSIAKGFQGQHAYGTPLLDLIGWGNVGLLKAARKYDASRGVRFVTCAAWYIRAAILRALDEHARTIRLPIDRLALIRRLRREQDALTAQLERTPTLVELAEEVHLSPWSVEQALTDDQPTLSLDQPRVGVGDGEENLMPLEMLSDEQEQDPAQIVCAREQEQERNALIQRLFASLTPREVQVVTLRFGLDGGEERSTRAISQELEMHLSRVYQLLTSAMSKLRHHPHAQAMAHVLSEPEASS